MLASLILLAGSQPAPAAQRTSFADTVRRYLQRVGSKVDDERSSANLVVSTYPDPKGGKTTIVVVNDTRKNLVGFYIYDFGSLKETDNREEVYRYLLSANDEITLGSFFVDGDQDIGYKYLMSSHQTTSQADFESTYLTMATVARERRPAIQKLLTLPTQGDDEPPGPKAREDRPPRA